MYRLIYKFGQFDMFIYGLQIYGFIYRFNLFYINWILVRMLVRMLSPKGDPHKILLEARNSSAFFVRMLVRDFVLTIIRTKKMADKLP